jgi:hypothetical protein
LIHYHHHPHEKQQHQHQHYRDYDNNNMEVDGGAAMDDHCQKQQWRKILCPHRRECLAAIE